MFMAVADGHLLPRISYCQINSRATQKEKQEPTADSDSTTQPTLGHRSGQIGIRHSQSWPQVSIILFLVLLHLTV